MYLFTKTCNQILKEIDSLLTEGKVLYLRKRKANNGIYIADIFDKLEFSEQFCNALQRLTLKKGRNSKNLGDFVRSFQSFKEAQDLFTTKKFRKAGSKAESDFARDIYALMEDCKNKARKSYQREPKAKCSFCCLCWREVETSSHYYCKFHLSSNKAIAQAKSNYYRDKRMIKNELKSGSHTWAKGLKATPHVLESVLDKTIDFSWSFDLTRPTKDNWKQVAEKMLIQSKLYLKYSYKKLQFINSDKYSHPYKFVEVVLKKLEPKTTPNELDNLGWVEDENQNDIGKLFLQLQATLIRHEAYETLRNQNKPRGPKKGIEKEKDLDLRRDVTELFKQGYNYSEIAKKLKKSRQRISVLAQELGVRS